jgi:hypothetical protein
MGLTGSAFLGNDFSVILWSDPQFWYDICLNDVTADCIFAGLSSGDDDASVDQRAAALDQSVLEMIQSSQELVAADPSKLYKAFMVNGDPANADSDGEQIQKFQHLFQTSDSVSLGFPLYLGLGNDDTYCDDCTGYVMRFYHEYVERLKSDGLIRDIDLKT